MLQRIRGVRQDDGSKERAWFQDEYFDLFVWTATASEVVAFQLCYDRTANERVLVWSEAGGFLHRRIDDGEHTPVKNMSPIMVTDGRFAAAGIAAEFDLRAGELDASIREFIRRKITEAGLELSAPGTVA
jgi:hypothetical protein